MKRLIRWFAVLALLLLLAVTGAGMWLGGEISRPARRTLEAHHREFVDHPQAHGVRLRPFTASDGTPVIVCEPAGVPSPRGRRVREQLAARKAPMLRFGACARVLVLTHGRRMRKEDMLFVAERFCAVGFRCIVFDLPGHGDHPGGVAGYGLLESQIPATVAREAAKRFGFTLDASALLGISMGGAVAVRSAAETDSPWKALALLCTFDDLGSVVDQQAARMAGPVFGSLLALGAETRFAAETGRLLSEADSTRLAARIHCPVLTAHGTADSFISPQAGLRLHQAMTQAKTRHWLEVPDAGHATIFTTDFPLFATLAEWLLREVRAPQSLPTRPAARQTSGRVP